MKRILQQHHRVLFYGSWILLAILQAGLTELRDDEAYYRIYALFPARGYFDHPPFVALFVKAGMMLFPGVLGIRFFFLLFNVLTVFFLEKLLPSKNPSLFYAILLSMALIQLGGYMAAPDILLIFFTTLFFYLYKQFTRKANWVNTLNLGFAAAALLYSKYHGVLVLVFTLLSDRYLFKNYKVYIAGMLALLLYMPHLYWQYQHDWISFRYHLFESNVNPYKVSYTFNYIAGQFLMAGPLAGFILLPAAFLYTPERRHEWAMYFTMGGTYLFFLLSSFRGKVEANWPFHALIPVIVLSFAFLAEKEKWRKWLFRLLPVTLVIVLLFRVMMMADIVPLKPVQKQFHAWKDWPQKMKEITGGQPVVFNSSYQQASQYQFHTGQIAYSLNYYKGRKNQFNFIPVDQYILGKPAWFFDSYNLKDFKDTLQTPAGTIGYRYDSFFVSFPQLQFITETPTIKLDGGGFTHVTFTLQMPAFYHSFIRNSTIDFRDTIRVAFFNDNGWIKDVNAGMTVKEAARDGQVKIQINPGLPAGLYNYMIAVNCGSLPPTQNSKKYSLFIY
ncbi:MAG TPA: glycosyltransferase family 39 protein [Chitinophagaceae bacterium]|nr:glycosyltransferase family 39 protein [Chitinophagaceae bacterium]